MQREQVREIQIALSFISRHRKPIAIAQGKVKSKHSTHIGSSNFFSPKGFETAFESGLCKREDDRLQKLIRSFQRRFGGRDVEIKHQTTEAGPEWYDAAFQDAHWKEHYSKSSYYAQWAVIVDRVHRSDCKRVLEIGCGPGQLAEFLLDFTRIDEYVGLDFSPAAIEIARQRLPNTTFVLGDARISRIYDEFEHDIVICTEVLEHIQDDLTLMSRFSHGKRCICTVPNFPYVSHVRHFSGPAEVADRYKCFFDDFDVVSLRSPIKQELEFYLFEGKRNLFRVS